MKRLQKLTDAVRHFRRSAYVILLLHGVFATMQTFADEVVSSSAGVWFAVDARAVKDTTWVGGTIVGGGTKLVLQSSPNAWGEVGSGNGATITWESTSGNSGIVAAATTAATVTWTPEARPGTNTLTFVSGSVVKSAKFAVVFSDPIPEIPCTATTADIAKALDGSADPGLTNNITTVANYNAYRAWAQTVSLSGGGLAGKQTVKDSQYAWLSFALDSAVLLTKKPVQGEMTIASFAKNATTGKFEFAVEITGVSAGTGASAENLGKVFGLEGATEVDGDYSVDNVVFTFGTPVGGNVVISALSADEMVTQFFMKVKMVP